MCWFCKYVFSSINGVQTMLDLTTDAPLCCVYLSFQFCVNLCVFKSWLSDKLDRISSYCIVRVLINSF
jgi:hypothetical protein